MSKFFFFVFMTIEILTLSYSMEQSPSSEANSHSEREEVLCFLWKVKVQYRVHKIPTLLTTLNQISPVHILKHNFCEIHFNIILPTTPMSPKWSSLQVFRLKLCMHLWFSYSMLYVSAFSFS
jgi:hypothetical protein